LNKSPSGKPGAAELRVRALVRNGSSTNAALRIPTAYIEMGSFSAGIVTPTRRVLVQTRTSTSYANAEIDLSATVAEDRFRFILERTGSDTTSYVAMGGMRVRKRMTGELIVDGAISADKIAANAVTAVKIAGNTITGNKIAANTITGGLLATSGIITQAAQINDALITTAKIGNLQVERIKIATGAVTTFDLVKASVSFNGQTSYGADAFIGSHSVTLASNANLVPERFIFRPRFSGYMPVVLSLASGQFGGYYRIRIKRNRAGTITELATYIEPFWQFVTDGTRMTQVLYAGVRPSTIVQITQVGSYQAGDTLIFEYYWHRFRSGSVNAAVEIQSYDLEVEQYFR